MWALLVKLLLHSVSQFHHLDNGNIKMIVKNKVVAKLRIKVVAK